MPSYELSLALRSMTKPELISTLKRVGSAIFDRNGVIRTIENLGYRNLPYKTTSHGLVHQEASFYIYKFDVATKTVADLSEEFGRDVDIIRLRIFKTLKPEQKDCSLEQELLPPSYRKDVQKMIAIGKTQQNRFTRKFKYNSGLDYYPFQK